MPLLNIRLDTNILQFKRKISIFQTINVLPRQKKMCGKIENMSKCVEDEHILYKNLHICTEAAYFFQFFSRWPVSYKTDSQNLKLFANMHISF